MSSYGLYGSISIYYKAGLRVSGCMRTYAYNLTPHINGIRLKLKKKIERYVRYVNIVNIVFFYENLDWDTKIKIIDR